MAAAGAGGGPYIPPAGFYQVGSLGVNTTGGAIISVSPETDAVLYIAVNSSAFNGTATVYKSIDGGATWTTQGTFTGDAGSYGVSLLAISNTTIILCHRGTLVKSTNSGVSFTTLVNVGGGQNNFYDIAWDGQYGLVYGYSRVYYTDNNWATASSNSLYGNLILQSGGALTNNGGNRFLLAPLGSSSTPSNYYITNAYFNATYASGTTAYNSSLACSDTATGRNYILVISGDQQRLNGQLITAQWPSTTYSVITPSLSGILNYGKPAVHPPTQGMIYASSNMGVYLVSTTGSATQISAVNSLSFQSQSTALVSYAYGTTGLIYRYW
jgi:photosystem II stability/assembly factor-like uncharacterized protein